MMLLLLLQWHWLMVVYAGGRILSGAIIASAVATQTRRKAAECECLCVLLCSVPQHICFVCVLCCVCVFLQLVAVVYSGLTLLVLVASFLKFHGHMSKIAFGLVMAVLCLSTLASLAGLRILSVITVFLSQTRILCDHTIHFLLLLQFLSTLCPWIVMSPCVILMQGTHGMLSYPSPSEY